MVVNTTRNANASQLSSTVEGEIAKVRFFVDSDSSAPRDKRPTEESAWALIGNSGIRIKAPLGNQRANDRPYFRDKVYDFYDGEVEKKIKFELSRSSGNNRFLLRVIISDAPLKFIQALNLAVNSEETPTIELLIGSPNEIDLKQLWYNVHLSRFSDVKDKNTVLFDWVRSRSSSNHAMTAFLIESYISHDYIRPKKFIKTSVQNFKQTSIYSFELTPGNNNAIYYLTLYGAADESVINIGIINVTQQKQLENAISKLAQDDEKIQSIDRAFQQDLTKGDIGNLLVSILNEIFQANLATIDGVKVAKKTPVNLLIERIKNITSRTSKPGGNWAMLVKPVTKEVNWHFFAKGLFFMRRFKNKESNELNLDVYINYSPISDYYLITVNLRKNRKEYLKGATGQVGVSTQIEKSKIEDLIKKATDDYLERLLTDLLGTTDSIARNVKLQQWLLKLIEDDSRQHEHETVNASPAMDPGGIDLNGGNMAMVVSRDANGGVKVNFNPALIEKIRREGIQSAVPILLNVELIQLKDVLPLYNLR